MEETNSKKPGTIGKTVRWLKKNIIPLAGLLVVIAIMAGILYINIQYPEKIEELKRFGYLGAFIISVIFNATLILPVGNIFIQSTIATMQLSPIILGLVIGTGASIGETTGYIAGRSGRGLIKKSLIYGRVEGWVKKWGVLTIFVFSVVPFIFDLVGIAAGVLRVPIWKFFLACLAGRVILYIFVVWLSPIFINFIRSWFG